MDDETEARETAAGAAAAGAPDAGDAAGERQPPAPIESRFLYVFVAAQRAKQLRRGARPRFEELAGDGETDHPLKGRKLERIAMREVEERKIHYALPPDGTPAPGE